MKKTINKEYEAIEVIKRRISYLLGANLRDKNRIKATIEKQDRIRKLHLASKDWNSVYEIRKWRDTR